MAAARQVEEPMAGAALVEVASVAVAVVVVAMVAAGVAVECTEEYSEEVVAGWAWSTGCQAGGTVVAAEAEEAWAGVGQVEEEQVVEALVVGQTEGVAWAAVGAAVSGAAAEACEAVWLAPAVGS
jgi:hypothetical protein